MKHITMSGSQAGAELAGTMIEEADARYAPISVGYGSYRAAFVDRGMLVEALMLAYPGQGWILQYERGNSRRLDAIEVGFGSPLAPDGEAFRADNVTDVPKADFYGHLIAPLIEKFRASVVDLRDVDVEVPLMWAHAQIASYASDEQLATWFLADRDVTEG